MADPKGISTSLIAGHTIIIDPMNTHVVAKVIHMGSLDVGTLCSDRNGGGYINKWAKYKPVTKNGVLDTTGQLDTSRQIGSTGVYYRPWESSADWWKGDIDSSTLRYTCGLEIPASPEVTASNTLQHKVNLDNWLKNSWKYSFYPKGGISSPYRLIDFQCYDHNAECFVSGITTPPAGRIFYAGADSDNVMDYTVNLHTANAFEISKSDIVIGKNASGGELKVEDLYFGLIFVKISASTGGNPIYKKYITTNTAPLKNKTAISLGKLTAGLVDARSIRATQDFLVYPILRTAAVMDSNGKQVITAITNSNLGTIYSVPNITSPFTIKLYPNGLDGFIQGGLNHTTVGSDEEFSSLYLSIINFWQADVSFYVQDIHLTMQLNNRSVTGYGGVQGGIEVRDQSYNQITGKITIPGSGSAAATWSYTIEGGGIILYLRWLIPSSYFVNDDVQSVSGYIDYTTPNGGSGRATMLSVS